MYRAEGKLSLAAQYLQRSLVAANTPLAPTATGKAGTPGNVPRGWETAMQRIGSSPLPGTNPFEGKTAIDTATTPNASAPFQPSTSPTQAVPNYLPPSQPAPYVAPYIAPTPGAPSGAPRPVAASGGYGPDMAGSGQSGAPVAAPLQPYPGQSAPGGYPSQGYQQAPAPYPHRGISRRPRLIPSRTDT